MDQAEQRVSEQGSRLSLHSTKRTITLRTIRCNKNSQRNPAESQKRTKEKARTRRASQSTNEFLPIIGSRRRILLRGHPSIAALRDGLLGIVRQFLRLGQQLQRLLHRRIGLRVYLQAFLVAKL